MNEIIVDVNLTPEQLEKMLANAKVGGFVQLKLKVNIDASADVAEVILR